MKIGIFSPTYFDLSLEETCRKAARLETALQELHSNRDYTKGVVSPDVAEEPVL